MLHFSSLLSLLDVLGKGDECDCISHYHMFEMKLLLAIHCLTFTVMPGGPCI